MSEDFFARPILNSPYTPPARHWELDADGQPTGRILEGRRRSALITPVPRPRRQGRGGEQKLLELGDAEGLSTPAQAYNPTPIINDLRAQVAQWRALRDPRDWGVTPETARLLRHWREHEFQSFRPFFCQLEAVETIIWLTEVAPGRGEQGARFLKHLKAVTEQANAGLRRIAMKLATGAGKTTVMAMLIAWQTVNAVRRPNSRSFSRGFLVVTPGITIRDRLRVLLPNDPESYYRSRELLPPDMLPDMQRAKIVITNYHAFRLREKLELAKGTREALAGWRREEIATTETEGEMIQRVMPALMGLKNIVVLNDEAHHCYSVRQEDPEGETPEDLSGEERKAAEQANRAAGVWLSGLQAVSRRLGVATVYDLSATPFFLRGSGYAEGTLFPWTMTDFSLMDAIESGIVKLPRVPIADNVPGADMPRFRALWDHIGSKLPRQGRSAGDRLDPLKLPGELLAALEALYGHYEKVFDLWQKAGIGVPPVFIVVCNNTATSDLVYRYISGFERPNPDGSTSVENGRLALFRNFDEAGNRLARPNTILIDSAQLESGEALDKAFEQAAADEIARFRRELVARTGDPRAGERIEASTLLREVMNTVGKPGRLGEQVRCVVSVSMLTEGWDVNTVTHILGVRAFGTQLLCEQVVGRALRRQSYELNTEGLFDAEYADILGIPFDFAAKPVVSPPKPPAPPSLHVHAVRPDRDGCEIVFPRVEGYRIELPEDRLEAEFGPDHVLTLTTELVSATVTENRALVGESAELTLEHLAKIRSNTILYELTRHLIYEKFRDADQAPRLHLFGQLKRIVRRWLEGGGLVCRDGTYPGLLMRPDLADMAAERIKAAITETHSGNRPVKAILDPYNPVGSTAQVSFTTSKSLRWQTDPRRCHLNWAVCDSSWEMEFCRVLDSAPGVIAWARNHSLGLEVPYLLRGTARRYIPDFVVRIDDGRGDPLNLVVEVKGFRGEDAKEKANAMRAYWVPGVNNLRRFGRWAFAEFTELEEMEAGFRRLVEQLATEGEGADGHRA